MWLTRHAHLKLNFSAITIQSHVRGFVTRQRFLHVKEHRAATFVQEANEAGALRLAKSKLEKQLEDLTWRLHLEKKIRVSNEEAKKIEISKLQKMLEALNLELDAAKLAKINECNKNAVLQNQLELSVKEKSALKRELVAVDELRKENALLKVSLDAFERKYMTLELELVNAQKGRDANMEKLRELEEKCSQLEQNEKKLEEKLMSLEDENRVLRQKALSTPLKSNRPGFAKSISDKYSSAITSRTERKTTYESPTPTKLIAPFTLGLTDSRRSKLTAEKHQDNYEFLSKCIKENLGFKNGKPIAARIIYKCLLHWHSFESERTTIFDSIIEGINEALKVRVDDIILPYWLSNTTALLFCICFMTTWTMAVCGIFFMLFSGPTKKKKLDWDLRLKVALGAAQGLAYLHHDCSPRIIHRDVKSSNILLDSDFEPHLTDFGIAKSLCPSKSHTSTYIMGTIGYIDPEYARTSRLTEKSDVYSYGIVLLELLTGRKAVDNESNLHHLILAKAATNAVMETVDPDITATCKDLGAVKKVYQLALLCTKRQPADRPTMHEVTRVLGSLVPSNTPPKQPAALPPASNPSAKVPCYMDEYANLKTPHLVNCPSMSTSDAQLFLKFGEVISQNSE
ncbi:hypothetical protein PHAVU_001G043001 [Phaseolus vulgaris]